MSKLAGRSVAVGALALALVLVGFSSGASAKRGWNHMAKTFINVTEVCRDGVEFKAAILNTPGSTKEKYKTKAMAAQPPPPSGQPVDPKSVVLSETIKVPRLKETVQITAVNEDETFVVSHRGSFKLEFDRKLEKDTVIGLNLEGFSTQSGVVTAQVGDCSLD
jgi:hypothetical protein